VAQAYTFISNKVYKSNQMEMNPYKPFLQAIQKIYKNFK